MSRTTRKHLRYDSNTDQTRLDPKGRDDKQRCDCCGNSHQIMANRRERRTTKHAIQQGEYPNRKRPDNY